MKATASLFWTIACSLLLQACLQAGQVSQPPQTQQVEEDSSWRSLARAYRNSPAVWVIYGNTDSLVGRMYRDQLHSIAKESGQEKRWRIVAHDAVSQDSIEGQPFFLVGTLRSNPLLQQWKAHLPLEIEDKGFQFAGHSYEQELDYFQLSFYPHPLQKGLPMGLIVGNSEEAVQQSLQAANTRSRWGGLWDRWSYQVFRDQNRIVMGSWGENWAMDSLQYWNFADQSTKELSVGSFQLQFHQLELPAVQLQALQDSLLMRARRVQEFLGTHAPLPPITYHAYPSVELMGLMENEQMCAFVNAEKGEVHRIFNPAYANQDEGLEQRLVLRHYLGEASHPALEHGLSTYFAPQWQKKGGRYWAARLVESGDRLSLAEVLGPMETYHSYLVRGAFETALVDFLLHSWGKDAFLKKYTNWEIGPTELTQLENDWQTWLTQLPQTFPKEARTSSRLPYYQGMTFAHEGYSMYDGYGSAQAVRSLEKINSLAANSIAIVPYSGSRQLNTPSPFSIWQRAGMENDACVIGSVYAARQLGMQSLLKPQIYFGGSWPGALEMKSEADWTLFFQHYRRWIRHYALLGEIYELDMFCVGVEFVKATTTHPDAWRKLIRDMRHLYQGPMTYAANWGEEIEQLQFGEELDFLGVDCYYPLSKDDRPREKELRAEFEKIKARLKGISKRFGKPMLFTEVGFRSIEAPWRQPHDEPKEAAYSEADQALCYQVVLDGLVGESWCQGLFWWKWPTYMSYGSTSSRNFTPSGKAAEQILKTAYQKGLSR